MAVEQFNIMQYVTEFAKNKPKLPLADKWADVFTNMSYHTRKVKPVDLLLKQRPNEEPQIATYRLENYRAITYGSMNRALDSIYRIISGINFTISNMDETTSSYVKQNQFLNMSLAMYLEKMALKRDIEDPNGVIAWFPTGDGVESSATKVQPKPKLFCSSDIVDWREDIVVLKAESGDSLEYFPGATGESYYAFTKEWLYTIVQVGKERANEYQIYQIYQHGFGTIPCWILAGDMNASGYFESFFSPYLAFGDEAICAFSDWQAVRTTSAFPYTEEFQIQCEIKVPILSANPNPKTTGEEEFGGGIPGDEIPNPAIIRRIEFKPMQRTPYGATVRQIPDKSAGYGEAVLDPSIPSRRFIHPDVSILENAAEAWKDLIAMAEQALHLNLERGSNIAAKTAEMQNEEHYAMVTKIATNFFLNIYLNSLKACDCYLNRKSFDKSSISINIPAIFKIKTEEDLVNEIGTMKTQNVPSMFVAATTSDLAQKRFSGDPVSQKVFAAIMQVDPLYIYSVTEKNSMLMQSVITKQDYIISVYAYSILWQIVRDKTPEEFLMMDAKAINDAFTIAIQPYIDKVVTPPAFDPAGNPIP